MGEVTKDTVTNGKDNVTNGNFKEILKNFSQEIYNNYIFLKSFIKQPLLKGFNYLGLLTIYNLNVYQARAVGCSIY